ncbi:MAG: peptidylprolyl isomerase [Candidatus Pelagibacter sp.]
MLKKKLFIYIFFFLILFNYVKSQEILIISKIENEVITNIDVEVEKKYLLLLNDNLKSLSEKEFFKVAKNSLIREKIKKREIDKLFNKDNDKLEKKIIENFYKRLGFDNKEKFIKFLNEKDISFESLKKKLMMETLWNQIIYKKFYNKIRIDEKSLKKKIIDYYSSKEKKFEYNLSEIIIDIDKDMKLKQEEISSYIKQFGFKIAANKFSKSNTSKYGGEIGWIKSSRLSKKIKNNISSIKVGEVSKPIQIPNGYLFLKLNDKREIKEKINLENELEQQIKFEKNRQLNQFSLNYYKKLKKNTKIYEN